MPWIVCLAQPVTNTRGKGTSDPTPPTQKQIRFNIVERVPILKAVHAPIWEALRMAGNRQFVIDADHPEEAFQADVVRIADIDGDAFNFIERALTKARSKALDAEKAASSDGSLDKSLDRAFDQQREWLALRILLAKAGVRPVADGKAARKANVRAKRALLLVDA
jgi:hypothetical protein